jgi:hypothetical protein
MGGDVDRHVPSFTCGDPILWTVARDCITTGGTVPDGIALEGVAVFRGLIDDRIGWDDAGYGLVFAVPFLTTQASEASNQTVGNFLAGFLQASEPLSCPNSDKVRFI